MDAAHEWTDGEIEALEKRLAKEYKQAVKEMRQKQAKLMKDFEREKSQRLKALDNTKEAKEQYERWLTNQLATQQWTQDLIEQLSQDAVRANQAAAKTISDAIPRVYAENANFTAYTVEKAVGQPVFSIVSENAVKSLVKGSDLLPVVNVPKDLAWNRQKFTSAITQSVLQGESIPNTAKRLESVFDMDKNSAFRAARTALTGAENAGRNDTYERAKGLGINLKIEWVATHDSRTRDSHRMLDGTQVDVDEPFKGELSEIRYPGDPQADPGEVYNCRCTTKAVIPGHGHSAQERFDLRMKELEARGIDTSGMSYGEWKNSKENEAKNNSGNSASNQFGFNAYAKTGSLTPEEYADYKRELEQARHLTQIMLPPDEYAHVMSGLNTHLSDEDRKHGLVRKAIGGYFYAFKNHGFNEYIIVDKTTNP